MGEIGRWGKVELFSSIGAAGLESWLRACFGSMEQGMIAGDGHHHLSTSGRGAAACGVRWRKGTCDV